MSLLIAAPFAHSTEQVYIEDKKRDATGAVVHADKQTVLLEAQRSLLAITHSCRLSCVLIVEGKKKKSATLPLLRADVDFRCQT